MENSISGNVTGPVLQTGVHYGDVYVQSHAVQPSAYLENNVRKIAPAMLVGREAELADLETFATDPSSAQWYQWWRANAWAGKSALLASFVLRPPDGVRIVSFFVTARFNQHDDRAAFIENVLPQLAGLVDAPVSPDADFAKVLVDAAEACRARDERLLLVVDGLDEDRGSYSIAALLPSEQVGGMRVVVSGRPNPPIPSDVRDDHPLRDPAIVRPLAPSQAATIAREDMQRDLRRLMKASTVERKLLGLLTVAGGGLTGENLAELTGVSPWEINECLQTVAGRAFASRASRWGPADVYILGHEDLRAEAEKALGETRLARYRAKLNAWADSYRAKHWPDGTPEYLLRGYFRMIASTSDVPRMVVCATDPHRHKRMRELSGGDAAALAEINKTQDAVGADLPVLARLAVHKEHLSARNTGIPVGLPALWITLGEKARANALVGSITDPGRLRQARVTMAAAMAARGDVAEARTLIAEGGLAFKELEDLAVRVAASGDATFAAEIAHLLVDPETALVRAAGKAVDRALDGTRRLVDEAMRAVASLKNTADVSELAIELAVAVTTAGDPDRAELIISSLMNSDHGPRARARVAIEIAYGGDMDRAERIIETLTTPGVQFEALAEVVAVAVGAGDRRRAERLTSQAQHLFGTASSLAPDGRAVRTMASVFATMSDLDSADALVNSISNRLAREQAWAELARAVAALGHAGQAERYLKSINNYAEYRQALSGVVTALVGAGKPDEAERIATAVTDARVRAKVLVEMAATMAATEDRHYVRRWAEQAGDSVGAEADPARHDRDRRAAGCAHRRRSRLGPTCPSHCQPSRAGQRRR